MVSGESEAAAVGVSAAGDACGALPVLAGVGVSGEVVCVSAVLVAVTAVFVLCRVDSDPGYARRQPARLAVSKAASSAVSSRVSRFGVKERRIFGDFHSAAGQVSENWPAQYRKH